MDSEEYYRHTLRHPSPVVHPPGRGNRLGMLETRKGGPSEGDSYHPVDILIVDDEVEIVRFLADMLNDEGYRVRVAYNGRSAIEAVAIQTPALMLLDYAMPRMNGAEVVGYLRTHGFADLPIVMMSAGNRTEALIVGGINDFLAKPFYIDTVLTCIKKYVRLRV